MAIAPAVLLFEALFEDLQNLRRQPAEHTFTTWVVVIAGDIAIDDLATDCRKAAPYERLERRVELPPLLRTGWLC